MGSMGRPRKARTDLPRRMYFHHGTYLFVPKEGPKVNLGRDYGEAITKYAAIVQPPVARMNVSGVMDAYIREKIPARKPRTQQDYLDAIRLLRPGRNQRQDGGPPAGGSGLENAFRKLGIALKPTA